MINKSPNTLTREQLALPMATLTEFGLSGKAYELLDRAGCTTVADAIIESTDATFFVQRVIDRALANLAAGKHDYVDAASPAEIRARAAAIRTGAVVRR